jgi:hypothetical protein
MQIIPSERAIHDEARHRTLANLGVVLEDVCRSLPHGGAHKVRKQIAEKLLDDIEAFPD